MGNGSGGEVERIDMRTDIERRAGQAEGELKNNRVRKGRESVCGLR